MTVRVLACAPMTPVRPVAWAVTPPQEPPTSDRSIVWKGLAVSASPPDSTTPTCTPDRLRAAAGAKSAPTTSRDRLVSGPPSRDPRRSCRSGRLSPVRERARRGRSPRRAGSLSTPGPPDRTHAIAPTRARSPPPPRRPDAQTAPAGACRSSPRQPCRRAAPRVPVRLDQPNRDRHALPVRRLREILRQGRVEHTKTFTLSGAVASKGLLDVNSSAVGTDCAHVAPIATFCLLHRRSGAQVRKRRLSRVHRISKAAQQPTSATSPQCPRPGR